MSSLDHSNEQDDQASINAGQESFAADGEATNNGNASPANTSAPNSEASNLSGNGSSDGMRLGGQLIDTKAVFQQAKKLANCQFERLVLWSCEPAQNLGKVQKLKAITGTKIISSQQQVTGDNAEIYSNNITRVNLFSLVVDQDTLKNWQGNFEGLVGESDF
ncbi:hypothetical protein [Prochlorococcus sp. MIT 1201]|uniref:hypothetical protein n=1 Tax=Prochlorococcus sp. MIT 1201 TaxID=3082535 RepID=UPI0039A4260E